MSVNLKKVKKTKQMLIEKSVGTADITPEQLEAINRYTRRIFAAEEVFVFTVILCDNEVDRDHERFPKVSLEKLADLFLGKTGIFDHSAMTEHQSARIYNTEVVEDQTYNIHGEPYCQLKAWAYMVRCDKNADLILEIDAGIKKEVSVGCAVGQILCSVCGADQKKMGCSHEKGENYSDVVCHHLLLNPTDAYEWSFVAVPAQKNAGVVKNYSQGISDGGVFARLKSAREEIVLTRDEVQMLQKQMHSLEELAKSGNDYVQELRRDVVRLASFSQPELSPSVLEQVCLRMDLAELKAFRKGFETTASRFLAPRPQLSPVAGDTTPKTDRQFKIRQEDI